MNIAKKELKYIVRFRIIYNIIIIILCLLFLYYYVAADVGTDNKFY